MALADHLATGPVRRVVVLNEDGSHGNPTGGQVKVTLEAATAATILAASALRTGARVLNWTASPVYVIPGVVGTPASGAPSEYIPAAAAGVPGVWNCPYAPKAGLRAVGAGAGDLTITSY